MGIFAAWILTQVTGSEKEGVVVICWGPLASEYKVFCLFKTVVLSYVGGGRSGKLKASQHHSKREEVYFGHLN